MSNIRRVYETYRHTHDSFSHNLWANVGILEQCADLTSEQLDATITGAFGSIRDTLQHFVRSEQGYFYRIRTGQPIFAQKMSRQ